MPEQATETLWVYGLHEDGGIRLEVMEPVQIVLHITEKDVRTFAAFVEAFPKEEPGA